MNTNIFHIPSRLLSLITTVLIPTSLFSLGVFLTIVYSSYGPFSVLSYPPGTRYDFLQPHKNEIIKGEIIKGQFKAKENNLGIVSVRFYNFDRISNDSLQFSIKEKGEKKWYYEQQYKVNQFQPDKFFTFGFPIIANAKGKLYEFQLQSLYGKKRDGIGLSSLTPHFITQYQFTKSELLGNKVLLVGFLVKKFINAFVGLDFKISSTIYFLPFISFLFLNVFIKKLFSSEKNKKLLFILSAAFLVFTVLLIICNILFVRQLSSNIAVIIVLTVWLWISFAYRFDSSITFIIALLFLVFCPIMVTLGLEEVAQRTAIWTYFFICVGIVHKIVQTKFNREALIDYRFILKKVTLK